MGLKAGKEKGIGIAEAGRSLITSLIFFLDLKISGTRYFRPIDVAENIVDFGIKKKEENIAGLQLIDSIITPVGRRYLNKRNHYIAYDVIKGKFRKHECGRYKGYDLIILPRK